MERTISLTEALCGFAMDMTHLDGRKLIIKSSPGEVIKPVSYDPLGDTGDSALWEMFENSDCPSLDNAAVAETEDLNVCKKAVAKGQLKGKGIGCFVCRGGKTVFKQCSTEQAMASKTTSSGSTLYVLQDPDATKDTRMMMAVKNEGLPRLKAPMDSGSLFIKFTIEFPTNIDPSAASQLIALLGPPKHVSKLNPDEEDNCEEVQLVPLDPVASFKEYIPSEQDDEDEEGGGGGGQRVQCAQQ